MEKNLELWVKEFVQDKIDDKYQEWLQESLKGKKQKLNDYYKDLKNRSGWLAIQIGKLGPDKIERLRKERFIGNEDQILSKLRKILIEEINLRMKRR